MITFQQQPMLQAFLNELSPDEAEAWKQAIMTSMAYLPVINYHHLSSTLNIDKLKSLKSVTPYDGKKLSHILTIFNFNFILGAFFEKWMQCEIKFKKLLTHSFSIMLSPKTKRLFSLKK